MLQDNVAVYTIRSYISNKTKPVIFYKYSCPTLNGLRTLTWHKVISCQPQTLFYCLQTVFFLMYKTMLYRFLKGKALRCLSLTVAVPAFCFDS